MSSVPKDIELREGYRLAVPSGHVSVFIADVASTNPHYVWSKRLATIRDLMLAGFCIVAMAGCGPLVNVPDAPKPDAPVVVERATAEDVFSAIAHSAESDLKAGLAPQLLEVAAVVKRLCDNGELTSADAVKFDAAFPGAVRSEVRLTADDIAKLKGLK